MAEEPEELRNQFRVIEGCPLPPRPEPASWPRRFKCLKRTRSYRRQRSGRSCLEAQIGDGTIAIAGWRGQDKLFRSAIQGRRPWGTRTRLKPRRRAHPPFRTVAREVRLKLQAATREEKQEMIAEAWETLMGLRTGKGVDPEVWGMFQSHLGVDPNG